MKNISVAYTAKIYEKVSLVMALHKNVLTSNIIFKQTQN